MISNVEVLEIDAKNSILKLEIHSDLDVDTLFKNAQNGRMFGYFEPLVKDTTTDEQRKHFYALINDIHDYTGEAKWKIKLNMKYLYMVTHDKEKEPSLARNKMKSSETRKLIQTVIDYCLENEIPLQKNYLSEMEERQLYTMTMKRICWVCGKERSQLAHYEAVGLGRNRNKIDHTKHHFMCLCQDCHTKQHQMGVESFMKLHHIKPIKLSAENLKELNIRGKYD